MTESVPAAAHAGCVSPSLRPASRAAPAFEVKFVVPEAVACAVAARAAEVLRLDPHAEPQLGDSYRTATVYFDTPDWSVYRRQPGYAGRKYRVRRYGEGAVAYLERKRKRRGQVRKRRTAAPFGEIARLAVADAGEWPGSWFAAESRARRLAPVCRVEYRRVARFGDHGAEGPIRLTFDRDLRATALADVRFGGGAAGVPVAVGGVVMEFKFQGAMPGFFRGLVADFGLAPSRASKYRRGVDALGLRNDGAALRA